MINSVALKMLLQSAPALCSPPTLERPHVQFGNCHERNDEQVPIQVRSVSFGTGIVLEEVRDNIRIYYNGGNQGRLSPLSAQWHGRTKAMKSSTVSSPGQKSPYRSSTLATGFTPWAAASSSGVGDQSQNEAASPRARRPSTLRAMNPPCARMPPTP